ncbi:hypothetical protein QMA77_21125 [Pantoea ananatis]|uniref:hypothetical protein n=1 Tax=Pantoea ananas TaxID=553 RepID=UPI0006A0514D|nr:hypothetical protein [Pantoea ananatis]KNA28144.1 hypothetical protein ACO03_03890 [Pantoea ananatis]MDI6539433.1 hypothetical protein [Pantoea ananatis]
MRRKEYNKILKESFGLLSNYLKKLKKERGYTIADLNANRDDVKSLIRNQYYEKVMNSYGKEKGMEFFHEMISRGEKIHVTYKFEDEE